jgi:hypothetical protein
MDSDDVGGGWILEVPAADACVISTPPPVTGGTMTVPVTVAAGIGIVLLIVGLGIGRITKGRK